MSYLLFSGNAHKELAIRTAKCLRVALGDIEVGHFSDGEVSVAVRTNVCGISLK